MITFDGNTFEELLEFLATAEPNVYMINNFLLSEEEQTQLTTAGYQLSQIVLNVPKTIVLPDGTTVVTIERQLKDLVEVVTSPVTEEPPVEETPVSDPPVDPAE